MAKKDEVSSEEKSWRAQGDLHTLVEAERIKKDPERIKAAMAEKKKQMAAMKAIGGDA